MTKRRSWGARGCLALVALAVGLGMTGGCSDDDTEPKGGAGKGGEAGSGAVAGGGAGGATAGAGGGGADAGAASCDCGDDVNDARVPLACACAVGACTTWEQDLPKYRKEGRFGEPYYVLFGRCASGYRTLSFQEAYGEQAGRRTYDADGRMVYDQFGGYSGNVPEACGFDEQFSLGAVTIGEDPSNSCTYCLFAGQDTGGEGGAGSEGGAGGAGGAGARRPFYPESLTPRCDPSLFE